MQTLLLYRLKAQSHSRGLFLFFIMQIAIVVACYQKQLNLTIALIGISAVLPFILQIIFVKPISGASYKVYNMLYIVAKQIKERGQMLNLYIVFYFLISYMLLSTIYDQKIIGVVIFGFVMLFQVFLNYIILKMSKNK